MGKSTSTLRNYNDSESTTSPKNKKRRNPLSPFTSRKTSKDTNLTAADPERGKMHNNSKEKDDDSEEQLFGTNQTESNTSHNYNPKGDDNSTLSGSSWFNRNNKNREGFYIERRRVLPKKPLQSLAQDGAEGLYIWFLSTWMRMRKKHFSTMATTATSSSNNTRTTRSSTKGSSSSRTACISTTSFVDNNDSDILDEKEASLNWRESTLSTATTIFDLDFVDDEAEESNDYNKHIII